VERTRKILNKFSYFLAGMFFAAGICDAWNVNMRFLVWGVCLILAFWAAVVSELDGDTIFGLPEDKDAIERRREIRKLLSGEVP
jgi:hypothetical protein